MPEYEACFHKDFNPLYLVSPNNKIWEITVSDVGIPILTDSGETFVPGGDAFDPVPSLLFAEGYGFLCLVSPNNHMWKITITDIGQPIMVDTGMIFNAVGGVPAINKPNVVFHPDYYQFLLVSPNMHIWEISIDNEGNPVRTDTGNIFNPGT